MPLLRNPNSLDSRRAIREVDENRHRPYGVETTGGGHGFGDGGEEGELLHGLIAQLVALAQQQADFAGGVAGPQAEVVLLGAELADEDGAGVGAAGVGERGEGGPLEVGFVAGAIGRGIAGAGDRDEEAGRAAEDDGFIGRGLHQGRAAFQRGDEGDQRVGIDDRVGEIRVGDAGVQTDHLGGLAFLRVGIGG